MTGAGDPLPPGLVLAWYGDDFTGSAAVMEVLSFAGLPAVLFLEPPTPAQLARFSGMRAVGVASTARAHGPGWRARQLPRAFDWLAAQNAPIAHYKVCSTLDSSPEIGSIGAAIDIAEGRFGETWTPCLIAAPAIRRYQAFGTLFAAAPGGVYRLDRHPVMRRHPVTPMDEADVGRHLARQTAKPIGLLDLEALDSGADAALGRLFQEGAEVVTLDAVTADHLRRCGALLWGRRGRGLFVVGSQGVEYALVAHWRAAGLLAPAAAPSSAGWAEHMMVVSGSTSSVTAGQIDWAARHGFDVIALDAAAVTRGDRAEEARVVHRSLSALSEGRDPLVFSARGPDDPAIGAQRAAAAAASLSFEAANARIGRALGRILSEVVAASGLQRVIISGGDTSGHASRELRIFAFTALSPTIPGAALLRAHSEREGFANLEIALKGGQMGSSDYFGWIKEGGGAKPGDWKGSNA